MLEVFTTMKFISRRSELDKGSYAQMIQKLDFMKICSSSNLLCLKLSLNWLISSRIISWFSLKKKRNNSLDDYISL